MSMLEGKVERHTGLDLLRIISLIFVCVLHFFRYSGVLNTIEFGTFEYTFFWMIESTAFVAVNCLMLISGYFLSTSSFKISKVFKFYLQIVFFAIVGVTVGKVAGLTEIGLIDVRNVLMSFDGVWWYISCYVQILLISPFLNIVITRLSKVEYILVIIMGGAVFSIIPTTLVVVENWTTGGSVMWYMFMYFIGAYIRKYNIKIETKYSLSMYVVTCVTLFLSNIIIGFISKTILGEPKGETLFYSYNSIIVFIASVALFLLCLGIEMKNKKAKKIVSQIASLTLGVYLFHEHPYIREVIFNRILFDIPDGMILRIMYLLLFILVVYVVGCLLNYIFVSIYKIFRLEKIGKKLDNVSNRIKNRVEKRYADKY